MQHSLFTTSPNAADPAERKTASVDESSRSDSAAGKIREARGILADLLLRDELAFGNSLLVGAVAEDLNRLLLELDQAAGLQQLFELWCTTP
jgi:hypothetical protein